jgi:hypothetical protein
LYESGCFECFRANVHARGRRFEDIYRQLCGGVVEYHGNQNGSGNGLRGRAALGLGGRRALTFPRPA